MLNRQLKIIATEMPGVTGQAKFCSRFGLRNLSILAFQLATTAIEPFIVNPGFLPYAGLFISPVPRVFNNMRSHELEV